MKGTHTIKPDGKHTTWKIEVHEDGETKELFIELPPELLGQMGWDFGDTLVWDINGDEVSVSKKTLD